jgi:putative holliday junction resolvase
MPADLSGPDGIRIPPRGVRIGVDVGQVRIGTALSDSDGLLATPVETVRRDPSCATGGRPADVVRIMEIVRESNAQVVYVGLPRLLSGDEGSSARVVRAYCGPLAQAVAPVQVRLVDERLTTVSAHQALRASGRAGRRHREVVDQAAAVVILQSAMDAEHMVGGRVGEVVGLPADGADVDGGRARTPDSSGVGGSHQMDRTGGTWQREVPL